MKKIFLLFLLQALIGFSAYSQTTKVIIMANNKSYLVYFPNGFQTTSNGIHWTGQAVATCINAFDSAILFADNPTISKNCGTAKTQVSSSTYGGEVLCGPQIITSNPSGDFSTFAECRKKDETTCMAKVVMGDGSSVWYWTFEDQAPVVIQQGQTFLEPLIFIACE